MTASLILPSAAATQALAAKLAAHLFPGATLLLQGDLGSGKTTFVQGLAQGLGIPDVITSPTFNLIHEYQQGSLVLVHGDLYRLTPEEVLDLGLEEYWDRGTGVVVIEWPERLPCWPAEWLWLNFKFLPDQPQGRELHWQAQGMPHRRLAAAVLG
ncbi:MAG: tRNA (adenosine(37)-N6)-threonylcarbamoyltransferase complex ATPase subunit type 1 TsaE [Thermostichales cyanobacterium SRBZ-1_bins_19]